MRMRSQSVSALVDVSRATANGFDGIAGSSVRTISFTYRSNVCCSMSGGRFQGSAGLRPQFLVALSSSSSEHCRVSLSTLGLCVGDSIDSLSSNVDSFVTDASEAFIAFILDELMNSSL